MAFFALVLQNFIQTLCKYALSHCEEPICPLDPSQGINTSEGVNSICESSMSFDSVSKEIFGHNQSKS